jgi:hypothetical protein
LSTFFVCLHIYVSDTHELYISTTAQTSTKGSYNVNVDTISRGYYKATFKMTGLDTAGYLAINWSGITNHVDSNSDSRVIACVFTDDNRYVYTGVLYVTDPGSQLNLSFWSTTDILMSTQVKPIVSVHLERLVQHSDCLCKHA